MSYVAEIIGVGTEILLGNTINTDARDVSEGLSTLGINVYYHTVVGDNPQRLRDAVEIARSRADIIITTGGLGPTYDDLTKQTLAECFGKTLVLDEAVADSIRSYFEKRTPGIPMPENNLQQAMLPEGCTILHNNMGSAPGCAFEDSGKHVIMLPGPPGECNAMFNDSAVPYLKKLSDSEIFSVNIRIFGMGESAVEQQLREMMQGMSNPTLAPYAKSGEVMLRLTAKAASKEESEALMRPVLEQVKDILGDVIYSTDKNSLEETVLDLLGKQNLTLSTAESCTGGLLSKRLTDVPGSSCVYMGGGVTYSNHAKTELLGVPPELIATHGAVSEPVARAMAQGIKNRLNTDFGIGITGIAGPDSDGSQKSVGTVFLALATPGETLCKPLNIDADRQRVRLMSVNYALDLIRRFIEFGSI